MSSDKNNKTSINASTRSVNHNEVPAHAIDWERAKAVINGNLAEAIVLFKQLMDFIPDAMSKIRQATTANDLNKMLESVHKLHGACSYSGTPRLKLAAKNLEVAIRSNDEPLIKELIPKLEQEYALLLQAAKHDEILNAKK